MKKAIKIISVILTVIMFFSVFSASTTVFAEEYTEYTERKQYEEKLLTETIDEASEKAEIVCEVPEKRDEFSKTYKRADGSYTSVISGTPIHTLKDGKWEEIDNTLKSDGALVKNVDGAFDVEFPETINENEKITVSDKGESISFSVNDIGSGASSVTTPETDESDIIATDLNKAVSEITYEDVNENTDIQYIVSSNSVKENIIVYNKESVKDTYSFDIEKGNLVVTFDDENNLMFKDSNNLEMFIIPAPVMTDADNNVSYDIDVSVTDVDKSVFTLTYTPSEEWLDDAEYPIIIDPVLATPGYEGVFFEDTAIMDDSTDSNSRNTNYVNNYEGYISNNSTRKSEVLVKFNMETFAFLNFDNIALTDFNVYFDGVVNHSNILAKTVNGSYDINTVTYNDVYPEDDAEPVLTYGETIDFYTGKAAEMSDENISLVYFNITDVFNSWLQGEANNGIALVPQDSSTDAMLILNGYEYTNTGSSSYIESYCAVDYVDTSSSNDSYEYLTQEIGRAGTANVNIFTRGLSISRFDLSMDGLRMPVSIDFNYRNSFVKTLEMFNDIMEAYGDTGLSLYYGNNWLPSYIQCILQISYGQYQFFTGEGTLVTFNQKEESVTETVDGEETTKTVITFEEDETSDSGYTLELIDETGDVTFENMKLISPNGEVSYFSEDGFVNRICEAEPNSDGTYDTINIVSVDNGGLVIDYITDGTGRKYDFVYSAETGLLSEIRCLTADNVPIKAGTTDVDLKVSYSYNTKGELTGVTYPDGEMVTYTYDSNGNLVKAQNIDNYNIQYTYDTLGKVTEIAEYANTTPGNNISLTELSNRQVKVTDDFSGTETYQFGKDGLLHYTFDEKGNYYKSDYATANDEDVYEYNDWEIASENLLKNGSFEKISGTILNSDGAKYWSNAFERVSDETAPNGDYTYCISSDTALTEYLEQSVAVNNVTYYTLSADVKSVIPEDTQGKLYLKIIAKNSSGDTKNEMQSIETAEDWTRFSVTFNPVTNNSIFAVSEITACIGFENSQGTYYIDDVQLETGKGTAEYNLIENGSFNNIIKNSPDKWSEATVVDENIYGKNVKAVKLSGGLPYYSQSGEIYTLNDTVSAVTQNVKINGKKGNVYSIGGWFNGLFDDNYINPDISADYSENTSQPTNSSAQIKVTYSYTETITTTDESTNETTTTEQTLTENFAVDFAPHNEGWQYAKDSFALKGDVESVDVTVITKNIPTDSFATGVELTLKEENSQAQEDYIIDDDIDFTEDTCSCGCEDCIYGDNCPCNGEIEGNCACPECLREETTAEDFFGNTISNRSFDGVNYIETFASYTENGNCVASYTDENGNTTFYDYDTLNSVLKSVTGQIGAGSETSITNYTYDAVGRIVSVSTTANDSGSQTLQYVYTDDKITEIITPNGKYKIVYDVWGQVLSVNIVVTSNNKESLIPLIKYTYNSGVNRNQILTATYVNSDSDNSVYEYTYYDNGTLKTVTLNKNLKHSIEYNNLGELTKIDNVGGRSVQYTAEDVNIYNDDGTLVYKSVLTDDGLSIEENYGVKYKELEVENDYDSLTGLSTQTSGLEVADLYRIEQSAVTDWFDREKSRTTTIYDLCGDTEENSTEVRGKVTTEYEYPSLSGGKTSSAIEKYINKTYNSSGTEIYLFDGYYYEYDKQNKISAEKILNSDGTTTDKYSYKYDKLGQLVRYNDIVSNKTYTYSYDANGNILSKNEYPYTLSDELGTATNTTTYGYDSQWKDKLTCVGDKIITYDNIGNPTSYLGATLTWKGRTLTSYEDETQTLLYEYDENGMRYRTTVTSKEDGRVGSFEYVWVDGKLVSIVFVSDGSTQTAKYLYNDFDEPVGMVVTDADGTLSTYYFLKNAQGDITNIVSASGGKLVEFTYDAFGNQTVHYQADPSTITGMMNWVEQVMVRALTPFGYRGYCYDTYSGLYYLQSRYYDPQTGRFINSDYANYLNATGTVLGCNLFAYCENDPVNRVDENGNISVSKNYTTRTRAVLKSFLKGLLGSKKIKKISTIVVDENYLNVVYVWYYKTKYTVCKMKLTFGKRKAWKKSVSTYYMSNYEATLDVHTGAIIDEMNKLALFDTADEFNGVTVACSQAILIYTLVDNATYSSKINKKMKKAKKLFGKRYYMFNVSKEMKYNGWYAYSIDTQEVVKI